MVSRKSLLAAAAGLCLVQSASAATYTLNPGWWWGRNVSWSTAPWSPSALPVGGAADAALVIAGMNYTGTSAYYSCGVTNDVAGTFTLNSLAINTDGGAGNTWAGFNVAGNALSFAGTNAALTTNLGANVHLQMQTPVAFSAPTTISVTGAGQVEFSGALSGAGDLTVGSGKVVINAAAAGTTAYSGNVAVNSTVEAYNNNALGANASGTQTVTVNSGGRLALLWDSTAGYAPVGIAQRVVLNGGTLAGEGGNNQWWAGSTGRVTVNANSTMDVGGYLNVPSLAGSGNVAKTNAGTLRLYGAGTYAGALSVNAGTLLIAHADALGTGSLTVAGGAVDSSVATVNLGGDLILTSGSISANGTGAGILALASGKSFSMSGGTLSEDLSALDVISGSGTGTFAITGGTLALSGTINYGSTYPVLSGFSSGSVSGLSITGYDSTRYTASLNNSGVLSFVTVPEPTALGLLGLAAVGLVRRRSAK